MLLGIVLKLSLCWSLTLSIFFTNSFAQQLIPLEKTGISGKDVTAFVFGPNNKEVFPVAYADFNSDKITDIFTLTRDQSTLLIFFGQENPSPLFKPHIQCNLRENWEGLGFSGENTPVKIVGVVVADFTGDSILDVMITYKRERPRPAEEAEEVIPDPDPCNNRTVEVVIFRGNLTSLDCSVDVNPEHVILDFVDEPLALDINGDMVMDLFGEVFIRKNPSENGSKCLDKTEKRIWLFEPVVGVESPVRPPEPMKFNLSSDSIHDPNDTINCSNPHINSFADIDGDLVPELVLVTVYYKEHQPRYQRKTYRIDLEDPKEPKFHLLHKPIDINITTGSGGDAVSPQVLGQSIFMDLNQEAKLLHLLPFCSTHGCRKGINGILVVTENGTSILPIQFVDNTGDWTYPFVKKPAPRDAYSNYSRTIVLRAGDFNLDGFPDLIGILRPPGQGVMNTRAVLFENVPCTPSALVSCPYPRTFRINFDALAQYHNATLATFFDLQEDGLVDIVLVRRTNEDTQPYADTYGVFAFQNSPDYDANFMKVMVLSGRSCPLCPQSQTPYGNILSGPVIKYSTTTQADHFQTAVAAQFYRSSHMSMDLPYTIFGVGQSPNFIETLEISVSTDPLFLRVQQWTQLIPNSQIIVIPAPLEKPWQWSAKLFLTPSRAVLNTGLVLIGLCTIICLIIGGLQYKERRDDMKERLQEAHRFHMF